MRRIITFLIFCLLSLVLLNSCQQWQLGGLTAAKNLITSPYRGIRDAFANRSYNKLVERTENSEQAEGDIQTVTCPNGEVKILDSKYEYLVEDLRDSVRSSVCACKAWGSCTKDICSCDMLCPKTLEILNRVQPISKLSSEENSLAFRNPGVFSNVADNHTSSQGHCWGHASITSKFNRLAFFDESKEPPYSLSSDDPVEQEQAIDFYKDKIDDIVDNKATDFPGFRNLRDLSDHPALQGYLGDKVATTWANNAMTFQGLFTSLKDSPRSREHNENFMRDVKRKIDNHEQPQIVFTGKGSKFATHAVLVSHYEVVDGKTILCIRDNNSDPVKNESCGNKIYLKEDGSVYYEAFGWGDIGDIKIGHNDNRETLSQVNSLHKRCSSEKGCEEEN